MSNNCLQPKPARRNITATGRTMTASTGKQAFKGNTRTTSKLPQPSSLKPKQAFQKGKLPQSP
jgi:hypothetical protein